MRSRRTFVAVYERAGIISDANIFRLSNTTIVLSSVGFIVRVRSQQRVPVKFSFSFRPSDWKNGNSRGPISLQYDRQNGFHKRSRQVAPVDRDPAEIAHVRRHSDVLYRVFGSDTSDRLQLFSHDGHGRGYQRRRRVRRSDDNDGTKKGK